MSAINPISNPSLATSAWQLLQAQPKPAASQAAAAPSALQEANETEATTRQEAARGDHVAIRKLVREHQNQLAPSAPAKPQSARRGGVNLSA